MKYLDDSSIVALLFERSEEAVNELEKKYSAACFNVAMGVLGNREDAEECVNDAMLRVWNAIPPARPQLLGAYVLKVTRNLAINRLEYNSALKRSTASVCLEELKECIPSDSNVEQEAEANELAALLTLFIRSLDRDERLIFMRRYWYMDAIGDIASLTGLRPGAVRTRLSRTRKRLRSFLNGDNERKDHEI